MPLLPLGPCFPPLSLAHSFLATHGHFFCFSNTSSLFSSKAFRLTVENALSLLSSWALRAHCKCHLFREAFPGHAIYDTWATLLYAIQLWFSGGQSSSFVPMLSSYLFDIWRKPHRRRTLCVLFLCSSSEPIMVPNTEMNWINILQEYVIHSKQGLPGSSDREKPANDSLSTLLSWKVGQTHCFPTSVWTKKYKYLPGRKEKRELWPVHVCHIVCWFRIETGWRITPWCRFKDYKARVRKTVWYRW